MDERRFKSRNPNRTREPIGMDSVETGNVAKDGYEVRHREPLRTNRRSRYMNDPGLPDSLMTEDEARYRDLYGDD